MKKDVIKRLVSYLKKYCVVPLSAAFLISVVSVSAFAADPLAPSFDLTTIMTDAATKIVTDLLAMISGILPVTITLMAASIGIAYAIKFIRKLLAKT